MQTDDNRDPLIGRFVCALAAVVSLLVSAFLFANVLIHGVNFTPQYILAAVGFVAFVILAIRNSIAAVSASTKT